MVMAINGGCALLLLCGVSTCKGCHRCIIDCHGGRSGLQGMTGLQWIVKDPESFP